MNVRYDGDLTLQISKEAKPRILGVALSRLGGIEGGWAAYFVILVLLLQNPRSMQELKVPVGSDLGNGSTPFHPG